MVKEARDCSGQPQGHSSEQQEQPGVPLPVSVQGMECSVCGSTGSGQVQRQYPRPGNVPILLETLCVPQHRWKALWEFLKLLYLKMDFEEVLVIFCISRKVASVFSPGLLELSCDVSCAMAVVPLCTLLGWSPWNPSCSCSPSPTSCSGHFTDPGCVFKPLVLSPVQAQQLPSLSQTLSWQLPFLGKLSAGFPWVL